MDIELELEGVDAPEKEHFIPCSREELVEHCLRDGRLTEEDAERFRAFCKLLSAYYHFQFHDILEGLKVGMKPFEKREEATEEDKAAPLEPACAGELLRLTEALLGHANFVKLDEATWARALKYSALLDLKTEVDVDDFERMVFYHQGRRQATISVKRWFRSRETTVDLFSRVVLFLQFRGAAHFERKGIKLDQLGFTPGSLTIMLFRNVPLDDLELLLPNVKLSLGKRDRLMILGPAVAAFASAMVKALPSLALLFGAILFFTLGPGAAARFGFAEEEATRITPTLLALSTVAIAVGGFAWKQYRSYKHKRTAFMKRVAETLFFRNLAVGSHVFHALIDAAEEEEVKEAILVYYHLLLHNGERTVVQLDADIEVWMEGHIGLHVNFDIEATVDQLERLADTGERLVQVDPDGRCHALPLVRAKALIDRLWDDAFQYACPRSG